MLIFWCAVAIAAYVLGSIPSGLLIGKLLFGIDVRDYGSHRTGATNVLRTMGTGAAVAATTMDWAKGALAVSLARWLLPTEPWAHALAALLVAAGHNWPAFVGFRGGRGVIVSIAAVGVLHFPIMMILVAAGLLVVWRTRYVSLGSILGAVLTLVLFFVFYRLGDVPFPYLAYALVGAPLVIISHRDNIARLLAGTESRVGQRVQTAT